MAAPDLRRQFPHTRFWILFDDSKNGRVFYSSRLSGSRFVFEVGISFLKASKPAMNGGLVDRLLAKDSVDIGDCSHRRGAAAPLVERKESTLG